MQVLLIASTVMWRGAVGLRTPYVDQYDASDSDTLAEFAGRNCYQAWERKNPKTQTNEGYLANILKQGHESVLEHASATFFVEGVSRSLTHELIRHRHLSFSELSQRYVNVEDAPMVTPPALAGDYDGPDAVVAPYWANAHIHMEEAYRRTVDFLIEEGFNRKQAREAARAVMPNATETKIVVSGNMRAWRDVIKKRFHVAADAEIREFATEVLRQLREIAPNTFQDIPETPYGME